MGLAQPLRLCGLRDEVRHARGRLLDLDGLHRVLRRPVAQRPLRGTRRDGVRRLQGRSRVGDEIVVAVLFAVLILLFLLEIVGLDAGGTAPPTVTSQPVP